MKRQHPPALCATPLGRGESIHLRSRSPLPRGVPPRAGVCDWCPIACPVLELIWTCLSRPWVYPPRCCRPSPSATMPGQRRSRPPRFRRHWRAATCGRKRRRVPARPRRSPCRCCRFCPPRDASAGASSGALVLAPTRELAAQIGESFKQYSRHLANPLKVMVLHGGVSLNPQMMGLGGGADVIVATPGRLLDLIEHNAVSLSVVSTLVLDEADRIARPGFCRRTEPDHRAAAGPPAESAFLRHVPGGRPGAGRGPSARSRADRRWRRRKRRRISDSGRSRWIRRGARSCCVT